MATELEITKRDFIHNSYNYSKTAKIALEDSQFLTFTEFLDEAEIINTPILSRAKDVYKNGNWSLLGYCCNSYQNIEDDIEYFDEDESDEFDNTKPLSFNWEYSIFNGFFNGTNREITKASKLEITKSISEVVRFIEKTFSNSLINDVSEARNLQDQLISEKSKNALDRIDIYIVTDSVIEHENLETTIYIKSLDLTCRIYYWDLKKWSELKRSKSKSLPINIDFKESDYEIYDVKFIEKKVSNKLSYYLAFFPGNLISDIYDINKTKVLESNVRVFLSAKRSTNKEIRKTIIEAPSHFFSYNNGISATAESVVVENDKIVLIKDFQIVNGGQTTATIHYSNKIDKYSLENVFVSVKITALKKDDEYGEMVNRISLAANSQTAVRKSDFNSNHQYLISLERLSVRNPALSNHDQNIYYFFERMNGQYNVTKAGKGNERQQKVWEDNHPRIFKYNKIDIARWYNMMYELPHIAALGGENSFDPFILDKFYKKPELSFGRYKTLIGFGLLFQRIYKLCGTAKGKNYPSLIIDPVSGNHSPVALSTAIYTMSYLHKITEGCIDYWSIYNFKHGVCSSLISKDRVDIQFDIVLEQLIIICWNQIAKYGGAAAQEKTKKKDCWDFVINNVKISPEILEELEIFKISKIEKEKRESINTNDEDKTYFESIEILLDNNAKVLQLMSNISLIQSNFLKERALLNNLLKKINSKEHVLTKNKVEETITFYNKLIVEGFSLNDQLNNNTIVIKFSPKKIFSSVFNNKTEFLQLFEKFVLESELEFEKNELIYNETIDIIEKFDREFGLSIDDFEKLNEVFYLLKI